MHSLWPFIDVKPDFTSRVSEKTKIFGINQLGITFTRFKKLINKRKPDSVQKGAQAETFNFSSVLQPKNWYYMNTVLHALSSNYYFRFKLYSRSKEA